MKKSWRRAGGEESWMGAEGEVSRKEGQLVEYW